MPYHKAVKTIVTGALAFTLITGSGIAIPSAAYGAAAITTPFTDVNPGHWSEKHVAKLYYQGIVTGYLNGNVVSFKPNQSITQQEAVLMTLRFAGLEQLADSLPAPVFPANFNVDSYFKKYIKLAFDKGLLDEQEEYALAAANSKVQWGAKVATREWMTKLIVKAIGQEEEANRLKDAISVFTDEKQFDEKYSNYVKAASGLGLVKGVTETTFSPKADVTRASLATILSRAQNQYPVQYNGQVKGIVTGLTDQSITLFSNNQSVTYKLDNSSLYYHYNTESPIAKSDLLLYGDAMIIEKEGKAAYIEVQGDKQHMKTISGSFGRVIEDEQAIYIWNNNAYEKIQYDSSTEIVDTNGQAVKLSALKSDTPITIIQDTFRSSPKALKITAAAQATKTSVSGTFLSFSKELITVQEGTELVSKFLADKVTVEIDGMPDPLLDDLLESDQVVLTLDSDERVTHVKVTNRAIKIVNDAQIASYVHSNKLLTILDANGLNPEALLFTAKTKIYYNDKLIELSSAYSMLTQNRKIMISYTGNTIVSVHFITKYSGVLNAVNASKNTLDLKLDNGSIVQVPYTSPAVEIAEKTSSTLADLKAGDRLTIELNYAQDRAATVKVHRSEQYEVDSVDRVGNKLRVKNESVSAYDLSLSNAKLLTEAGAEMKIDAVKIGSIINVDLIGKSAETVQLVTPTVGQVTSIAANSVSIQDMTGKSIVFVADSGFIITKGTTQSTNSSALAVGDYVEVTVTSSKHTRMKVAKTETRTFTTYSPTGKQLWTDISFDGDNSNYFYITDQTKIMYNGSAVEVSSLKKGDVLKITSFRNTAVEIIKS